MDKVGNILAIILGLIMILCPLLAPVAVNTLFAIMILALGIYLLVMGVTSKSTLNIILGLLVLIVGILILINPTFIVALSAFLIYLVGIIILVVALINIISGSSKVVSIIGIIIGVVYIAIANVISDPKVLGFLIGLGFLISGIYGLISNK